ncbi:FecR domain-containing protein [Leptothoe spongobia TAU-MAC 1115]|uniref:FecR domain-containing protein n=2 Tax=Leptothoe TaxID=2651725 RepID=A0A947GKQ1_9CYAN|nr:FecR domain-containing protein [Leptothoe spongobia TAU-MAC 1115]
MTVGLASETSARPLSVRVNRWLELRNASGTVDFLQSGQWRQAQVGQRLGSVGDGLRTGAGSLARLALDTQVGFVTVSENTTFSITQLYTTPRGGKVTELDVPRGQVRLFVRRFTNPDSSLEIRTPAGVNGVRGTDFGIAIQPSGRSSLAVEEGSVASSAQGESVTVPEGYQNYTIPGQPPSEPMPITEDPNLNILRIESQRRDGEEIVFLDGATFFVNSLVIEGVTQEIIADEDDEQIGTFSLEVPLPADRSSIEVKVITPLGKTQIYDVVFR